MTNNKKMYAYFELINILFILQIFNLYILIKSTMHIWLAISPGVSYSGWEMKPKYDVLEIHETV